MVVRGRTRNAIGPQGRVGSTPTISAYKGSRYRQPENGFIFRLFALSCPHRRAGKGIDPVRRAGSRPAAFRLCGCRRISVSGRRPFREQPALGRAVPFPVFFLCGAQRNHPRSPCRLKACGLSLMRLSPHIRERKKTVPGAARLGAGRSLPGFLPLRRAKE